jgi:hypothetical protein
MGKINMIESIPEKIDAAFLYFHTRRSAGDEITPYLEEIQKEMPTTYLWAGDGPIEGKLDDPVMGRAVNHGITSEHYWFVFPKQGSTAEAFQAASEAMGAVLVTAGGYANALVDQTKARFHLPASRVILCGHQHGACLALASAMMRREDPFKLTILFDPWPLETLYLQNEHELPQTKVICIDNLWVRERERQRGATKPLYQVFQQYGMNTEGVTLAEGEDKPDEHMFREAVKQIKAGLG